MFGKEGTRAPGLSYLLQLKGTSASESLLLPGEEAPGPEAVGQDSSRRHGAGARLCPPLPAPRSREGIDRRSSSGRCTCEHGCAQAGPAGPLAPDPAFSKAFLFQHALPIKSKEKQQKLLFQTAGVRFKVTYLEMPRPGPGEREDAQQSAGFKLRTSLGSPLLYPRPRHPQAIF